MRAEIMTVGTELLLGDILNTNAQYLSQQLAELGFDVFCQTVVGDNHERVIANLRDTIRRSHLIITTGGLGPTQDDITKESVSEALGIPLVFEPNVMNEIENYFRSTGRTMTDNNKKQAYVPEGATIFKNDFGTAPGLAITKGNQCIIMLPGPPKELEPMFENYVKQFLRSISSETIVSRNLHIFGLSESQAADMLGNLLQGDNPTAALYAKTGDIQLRVSAKAGTGELASGMCDDYVKKICSVLGDNVYSTNNRSMEETVVDLLAKRGLKIATAESCTGGLLSQMITSVDGASQVFEYGLCSYSAAIKNRYLGVDKKLITKYGVVSSVCAGYMALAALKNSGADIGLAVTGVAGPQMSEDKPVGTVYVSSASRSGVFVKKLRLGEKKNREAIRELSAMNALDMARRMLVGEKIPDARFFKPNQIPYLEGQGRPRKKKKKGLALWIVLIAVLLLAASGFVMREKISSYIADSPFSFVLTLFDDVATAQAGPVGSVKDANELLTALAVKNPDAVAVINAEGSLTNVVAMQTANNYFYIDKDINKEDSVVGLPFFDYRCDLYERAAKNLIMYDPAVDASGPLGGINKYSDMIFTAQNNVLKLTTLRDESFWEVIGVMYITDSSDYDFLYYNTLDSEERFDEFIINVKMRSLVECSSPITYTDGFLTVIAATDAFEGGKIAIVAHEISSEISDAVYTQNATALYPNEWHDKNGGTPVNYSAAYDKWFDWVYANLKKTPEEPDAQADDPVQPSTTPIVTAGRGSEIISVKMNGAIVNDTRANIIAMVVAAEMGSGFSEEALKAQALAAISWIDYSSKTQSAPSVPGATPDEKIIACVNEVADKAIYYDGEIAYTPYGASVAGKTNACDEVWTKSYPYLISVDSIYDETTTGYSSSKTYTVDAMRSILENYFNIKLSDNYANWIKITSYTSGGYVKTLSIDGQKTVGGNVFRESVLAYGLRSAAFEITSADANGFTFLVKGYGHGVGMSQVGANQYAIRDSWSYSDIIYHYFPGTTIQ